MLKSAAVSALTTFIRDSVREYAPSMSRHIDEAMRQRGLPVNNSTLSSNSSSGSIYSSRNSAPSDSSSLSGRHVSSSPTESFDAVNQLPNADYDDIGQMDRVGMPPQNNTPDSEYYETYTPDTSSDRPQPPAVRPNHMDEQARNETTNYAQ